MLVAYFDESGTHGNQSRVVTVAGLLGDTLEWARIEPPWKKLLGEIGVFHATDCANQEGNFRYLTKRQSASLADGFASLVADRRLVTIGASVYMDDWNYGASPALKAQWKTPYHFCLSVAIIQACKASKELAGDDTIAFVFATQPQFEGYARFIHEVYGESESFPSVGSLCFASPQSVIPLQAADLYSYETYRELLAQLDTPGLTAPARSSMRIIESALPSRNVVANINYLHKCSDGLESVNAGLSFNGGG